MFAEVERRLVTHAFWVPAVVQGRGRRSVGLQSIGHGGAPMTEPLLLRAPERRRCGFLSVYGMTETSGTVLVLPPEDHEPGGPRAHLLHSEGHRLPWVERAVKEPVTTADTAPGEVGEIWIRCGQNMAACWHQPDVTAAVLCTTAGCAPETPLTTTPRVTCSSTTASKT